MKKKLLFLILIGQFTSSFSQSIQINQITPTSVNNGINVNLLVTTYNGAGYLSHNYNVIGNTINLEVCYWFNVTLPVYPINNDFLISVPNNENYIINVSVKNSSSQVICDYFSNGPTATTNYLSNNEYLISKSDYSFYPNPSKGIIEFSGNELLINNITIYDKVGRMVKKLIQPLNKNIDLNEFENGMYIVKIGTDFGILNQKIILKK
jgi:Secretion system C-terminal sorting domain